MGGPMRRMLPRRRGFSSSAGEVPTAPLEAAAKEIFADAVVSPDLPVVAEEFFPVELPSATFAEPLPVILEEFFPPEFFPAEPVIEFFPVELPPAPVVVELPPPTFADVSPINQSVVASASPSLTADELAAVQQLTVELEFGPTMTPSGGVFSELSAIMESPANSYVPGIPGTVGQVLGVAGAALSAVLTIAGDMPDEQKAVYVAADTASAVMFFTPLIAFSWVPQLIKLLGFFDIFGSGDVPHEVRAANEAARDTSAAQPFVDAVAAATTPEGLWNVLHTWSSGTTGGSSGIAVSVWWDGPAVGAPSWYPYDYGIGIVRIPYIGGSPNPAYPVFEGPSDLLRIEPIDVSVVLQSGTSLGERQGWDANVTTVLRQTLATLQAKFGVLTDPPHIIYAPPPVVESPLIVFPDYGGGSGNW